MNIYLDSSVLLRKIFGEPGAISTISGGNAVFSSDLLEIECLRTIDRMRIQHHLTDQQIADRLSVLYTAFRKIQWIQLHRSILDRAKQPFPTLLGTLDAIHLASALALKDEEQKEVLLLTHDFMLARAATSVGLSIKGT